jgi:hypothetical protein
MKSHHSKLKHRILLYFLEVDNYYNHFTNNIHHPSPNLHKILNILDSKENSEADLMLSSKIKNIIDGHTFDSIPHNTIITALKEYIDKSKVNLYE